MRLMRSPRATSSPIWTKGTIRRAIQTGDEAHTDFLAGGVDRVEPEQDVFSFTVAHSGFERAQELAVVYLKKETLPPTDILTWTLTTEEKSKPAGIRRP